MARELYRAHPVFARTMRSLDTVFGDAGLPGVLREIYREDRTAADPFDTLAYTHPAILMVELALVETLRAEGVRPGHVLGASLGEFAAAAAAGVLDVEDLARSIAEQVRLVDRHCPPGGMIAVLDDIRAYRTHGRNESLDQRLSGGLELAAVNFDQHFVLTGEPDRVARQEARLRADGRLCQRLPVTYAFHSRLMDVAAEPYRRALSGLRVRPPAVPFVSCAAGTTLDDLGVDHFWRMVREPIDFRKAVLHLEGQGRELLYLDLGPSATMANFATRNFAPESRSKALALVDPFAREGQSLERLREVARRPRHPAPGKPAHRGERMKAIIFPGQGSQSRGMGADLFPRFPELVAGADEILGYSVAELCREDPDRRLDSTEFTQPALYTVSALSYLDRVRGGWHGAHFFAGHSLGEYTALFAAGAFDFLTGLRLVMERGRLMGRVRDGGMAAVIGLDEEEIRTVLTESGLTDVDVANYNSPDQLILSGAKERVHGARDAFLRAGARNFLPLRVSGAFHSRFMEPARGEFEEFLAGTAFGPLTVPVIANVTGREHVPDGLRHALAEQLVRPVRWEQGIRHLLERGVTDFQETGPGTVLTRLVDRIRQTPAPQPPPAATTTARATGPTRTGPAHTGTGRADSGQRPDGGTPQARGLGSEAFRTAYGTRYAYACGSMYRGIASEDLVIRAARAGLLAFFGSGGLERARIASAVDRITAELGPGAPFGVNLVHNPTLPAVEDDTVDLLLSRGIRTVEASAFMKVTRALVHYRLSGLTKGPDGEVRITHRLIAKVSRPEVAESFLSPPPQRLVGLLEQEGLVTAEQAALATQVPMADDLCVEADSGGHTDRGNLLVLLPAMQRLRDRITGGFSYPDRVRVGAAGGIGTPEAAAAAFLLGADFVLTGSINQCTVEADMSDLAKDMLQQIDVQDTDYAPAGDMFELGAQVQVLKRGVFFPARARKLHELYRRHASLEEIDPETRALIEQRYFRRPLADVWRETREFFAERDPEEVEKAERNPKHRMALVFRWYFGHSQRAAMAGSADSRVDFQVHCGPALGAFNQWVKGTRLEDWRARHVDEIGVRLMEATARHLHDAHGAEARR
ncbi:ACP S-malonyltransferase [Streptomyces sp. RG38]|uniref:[acyl-carrier-protein] S-malonyltransferase n=2 Tax=Streptomyces tagetis TaxID=2820809 RepID=A0A940XAS4_9ACTN|nr:ACP S-malonyltransferase [Streptomyces sp. RG38]